MNKLFAFLFSFSFLLHSQKTNVSYLKVDKNPFIDSLGLILVKSQESLIKESVKPFVNYNFSDNLLFKSLEEIQTMAVFKDCEMYYSKQARNACMSNNVFQSVFQYLVYPKDVSKKKLEFGSVVFYYIIDDKGTFIPYSLNYNSEILKNAVLIAINKWYPTVMDYISKPAVFEGKPTNYVNTAVFSFLPQNDGVNQTDLVNTTVDSLPKSEIILNTQLDKKEIHEIKLEKDVNIVKPK